MVCKRFELCCAVLEIAEFMVRWVQRQLQSPIGDWENLEQQMSVLTIELLTTIIDQAGRQSTFTVNVPFATDPVQALEAAQEMLPLTDALTVGKIIRAGIFLGVDLSGVDALGALSDVQEKAAYLYRTLNNFPVNVSIPAFDEAKIDNLNAVVDRTDADVIAWEAAIISGIATPIFTGTVAFVDSRGEDIVSVESAIEAFRPRKRMRR